MSAFAKDDPTAWTVGEAVLVDTYTFGFGRQLREATVTAVRSHGPGKRVKVSTTQGDFSADGVEWTRGVVVALRKRDAEGLADLQAYRDSMVVVRFKACRRALSTDAVTQLAGVLRSLGLAEEDAKDECPKPAQGCHT